MLLETYGEFYQTYEFSSSVFYVCLQKRQRFMITNINFRNYRIFSEQQSLRLAPMTIVFGKNNVGKTAVLRLPLLIQNAFECGTEDVVTPILSDGSLLFDDAKDLVYGKANRAVELTMTSREGSSLDVSFYVENDGTGARTRLERWDLHSDNGELNISRSDKGEMLTPDGVPVKFSGIRPEGEFRKERELSEFQQSVYYLKAVRESPQRDFRVFPFKYANIGSMPFYDALVRDSLESQHLLLDKVSEWYERNFDHWKVLVDKHRAPIYSIMLDNDVVKNNILDTGMGIVQSLPIVISAYMEYSSPALIILEEPETHLHPAAHGELSELLALQSGTDRRFLVETHSQNFIMRLRCMIASGRIDRKDIALYFVDYDKNRRQSILKEVMIGDNGDIENWPSGIFSDSLEEALKLRRAQQDRKI